MQVELRAHRAQRLIPAADPRYEELERIGRGSQGSVYTVRLLLDGSVAVLKRVRIGDDRARASALREAEHMLRVQHAAVVGCRDCFVDGDELCIVMEYCEGGDLRLRIELARMSGSLFAEEQVLMWLAQLALALHHVHERGLLHRDLKTENVFISSAGLIKLGDFGIAIGLGASELAATAVGTPYYMSPELFLGKPYAHEADVWALGCILVEMCSQCVAFEADNLNALSLRVMRGAHQSLPPKYSPELHALVRLLLSVNPAGRPSVAELLCTPILRRHIASYTLAALGGFSLEAQLASPPLAALRSQLSAAGLSVLLNSITPSCLSPLRLRRATRLARPAEAGSACALACGDCRAGGSGSGGGAALGGAGTTREQQHRGDAKREQHHRGEDLVQQLLDDEQERLRVEMAMRKLESERRARQKQKQREAGAAGRRVHPGGAGCGAVSTGAGDGCAHPARATLGRSAAYGRRSTHPAVPRAPGSSAISAASNVHRRHGGGGSPAHTFYSFTGVTDDASPPSARSAHGGFVRLLAPGELPLAALASVLPPAHFIQPPMHGRRHRNFGRGAAGSEEEGYLSAQEERELVVETEHGMDLSHGADDVFAGFRMPNTAHAGAIDLVCGVEEEGEAEDPLMSNDGTRLTTWRGPALQYLRMDDRGEGQSASEGDDGELPGERTATAAELSMSAKERVLARRARQKLEEEARWTVALDSARRRYFSERQEAVQMQRDQYRGREGLSQALHLNTDRIDATLGQVHRLTERLTPKMLLFVQAHTWGQQDKAA
jgi:hypothetical protein